MQREEAPPPLGPDVFGTDTSSVGSGSYGSTPAPMPSPKQMALGGWQEMQAAKSAQEQCQIGISTARNILYTSTNQTEQVLAATALAAYDKLGSMKSAVSLLYVTLGALAMGTTGSIGVVLAKVGRNALANADGSEEKCKVGTTFATAINQFSKSSTEKTLITTAMTAYGALGSASSGANLMDHIMSAITPWPSGPIEVTLGKAGLDCMNSVLSSRDKCRIGTSFTKAILATTSSVGEKEVAQKALDDYKVQLDAPGGASIIKTYLTRFSGGMPPYPIVPNYNPFLPGNPYLPKPAAAGNAPAPTK